MTHVYFHCSSANEVLVDSSGSTFEDLAEARDHATSVARSLIMERGPEDWRDWVVHVNDDLGEEIFVVPFAFLLGKPH